MRSLVKFKYVLGIIIPFLTFFLMSQNVFATDIQGSNNQIYLKDSGGWTSANNSNIVNVPAGVWVTGQRGVIALNNQRGDYYSGTVNFYLSNSIVRYYLNGSSSNLQCFATQSGTLWSAIGNKFFEIAAFNISRTSDTAGRDGYMISASFSGQSNQVITSVNNFACEFYLSSGLLLQNNTSISTQALLYHHTSQALSNITVTFATDSTQAIQNLQSVLSEQNTTIINQNQTIIDQENAANDNISNQNTSDISGAENQATTNLIGVLSSFLTQLQGFSATNCNLSMPFPEFFGGTQVVNICQGKDVLGNFITLVGTLAMVGFYIPLAMVLLKMIYNEIRSFTNG